MSSWRVSALAIVADLVAVVVFAAIGRMSHGEPDDLLGLLGTAAPFLLGVVVMWSMPLVRANPVGVRAALAVWAGTAVIGLLVRAGFTWSLPPSFAVVTAVSLAVLMLGWRALSSAVSMRARQRALH